MIFFIKTISHIIEKMRSLIKDEEELLSEINNALLEAQDLCPSPQDFIEPCRVKSFHEKWKSTYFSAKKKQGTIILLLGLYNRRTHKLIRRFIKIYEDLSSKQQRHNDALACQKANDAAKFILPVEGKMLDEQQMQCIVKEMRNHLVLAGAGTGKTTTIVGYVKYLIKSGICNPNDILVLSFTNASAFEMSERLNKEIGIQITAQTFHKLGIDIITYVEGKKPRIYSNDLRNFARQQIENLISDPVYLLKLSTYLITNGAEHKSLFDFQTEEEYNEYLRYNPPITLKRERVKSYGELDIANFLIQNGVNYEYERQYPIDTRTDEFGQYCPDFYLPDHDLYIEYFGINKDGNVPSYFRGRNGKSPTECYKEAMKWKRELHSKNGTSLIEVYAYEKLDGKLLCNLERRLKKKGVLFNPISSSEIWDDILDNDDRLLDRAAEIFSTVITLTKSNNMTLDELLVVNHQNKNLSGIDTVIDLIRPVYDAYQGLLRARGEIDFNDMINQASVYVQSAKFIHSYKVVIIDEYQDISHARYRLIDMMRQQKDFRLFCVGDDWQSIYRFNGSDIGFILNFETYWGASEISRIESTYRFPQSLIDVSGWFIMKNPKQMRKNLKSDVPGHGFAFEQIELEKETSAAEFIAQRLDDLSNNSSVLFLGRYRFDIRILDGCDQLSYSYDSAGGNVIVTYSKRPDLKISFMTVHGSKGLQADYVFLLNNKATSMGFPSQISDAPVVELLLDNSDKFPFSKERRLFYVAITRAKNKVWFLTIKGNKSVFLKEIEERYGDEMRKAQYTCPLCGGALARKNGPYGEFWGCSNFKIYGCRYTRNTNK